MRLSLSLCLSVSLSLSLNQLNLHEKCLLQIQFEGNTESFEQKMSFPVGQDILSTNILNMNMEQGFNTITVQAIGKLLIASDRILYNVTLSNNKPMKDRKFFSPT